MAELAPTRPALRLVRDESSPTYDGQERRAPFCMVPLEFLGALPSLDRSAIAVYIVLAGHANSEGKCWPGAATIAREAGISRSQVFRTIPTLQDLGLVAIDPRRNEGMKNQTNVYTLVAPVTLPSRTHATSLVAPTRPKLDTDNYNQELDTPPLPPKGNGRAKPEDYTEGFDIFWAAYPRKDKRKGASEWWAKHKPDGDLLQRMLTSIKQQGLADLDQKFCPMPTTWLNGEQWNNESAPSTNGTRRSAEQTQAHINRGGNGFVQ